MELKKSGYYPDIIIAHPGWGESLFLKDIWPKAKLGIYCEFFYAMHGADVNFDPEFPSLDEGEACRLRLKNLNSLLHFEGADAGLSPTYWQASTFPEPFRSKISVSHDGIDTNLIKPNPDIHITLNGNTKLTKKDEVITFVNRNLEPYRGYHIFMRSLPEILKNRPQARILIVGGDSVSYGSKPKINKSWKDIFIEEIRPKISDRDWERVFFLGNIPYNAYIALLQVSSVHVYLTYPFVLSWSLLEAMSAGCCIVASDTAPVREVIKDDKNGLLIDFFDHKKISDTVSFLLANHEKRQVFGLAARQEAKAKYDLNTICLSEQLKWVQRLGHNS